MCDECNPTTSDGIEEANQWAEQYFGGINEEIQKSTWSSLDSESCNASSLSFIAEWQQIEEERIAMLVAEERIAHAIVVPPGGSPGGGGIVVPPGGGPDKKKKHPHPPIIVPPGGEPGKPKPPIIVPPGGSPGEGRGEGDEDQRLYWMWVTTGGACPICLDNEAAGPIIQYDTFPDGSTAPPAHPNCRCWLEEVSPDAWDPNHKTNPGQDKEIDVWYGPQDPGDRGTK